MKAILELSPSEVGQVLEDGRPRPLSTGAANSRTIGTLKPKRQRPGALQNLAAILALTFLAHAATGQTWQTVDDFQYVTGPGAWNFGVAVAPSGVVFASGSADASGGYHGVVMASADSGNTWSVPLDDFTYSGAPVRYDAGIASDAAGNLYVPGSTGSCCQSDQLHWLVRRGTVGGTSWATADDFTVVGGNPQPNGVAADGAGNVYVVGVVQYTNGVHTWTVRKGVEGTSFSTVDSYSPGGYGSAQAVFAHPTAGLFAAGYTNYTVISKHGSTTYSIWTVRRSLDGGSTWTTVDGSVYGEPRAIGADAAGSLYVVGGSVALSYPAVTYQNELAPSGSHWLVRKSSDGGNSWTTVDDFYPCVTVSTHPLTTQCPFGAVANGFAADASGNLFVVGSLRASSTSPNQWVVRESQGGSGAWTTVDTYSYAPSQPSAPAAAAADALGNVFVGGWGQDSSGVPHWLVRRN